MLIRCLQQRAGGTVVPFGKKGHPDYREYHFEPSGDLGHVCEVEDELDITTLLAISEAFVDATAEPSTLTEDELKAIELEKEAALVKAGSFLDLMDREQLEAYAKKNRLKIDPRHTDEQARNYLKGRLRAKG